MAAVTKNTVKGLSKLLDMSHGARRKRAKGLGFDPDEVYYHGSTHDITDLDARGTNPESDWGQGFYASSTPDDASENYAGVGPDLKARVDQRLDELVFESDEWDEETFRERIGPQFPNLDQDTFDALGFSEKSKLLEPAAVKDMTGDVEDGVMYPLHVRTKDYAHLGGENPTYLKPETDYLADARAELEYEGDITPDMDEDDVQDLISERAEENYFNSEDTPSHRVKSALLNFYDNDQALEVVDRLDNDYYDVLHGDGLPLSAVDDAIREASIFNDEGMYPGPVSGGVMESLGFPGVVDHRVPEKFSHMDGVYDDTRHVITFPGHESNVRSTQAAFDPDERGSRNMLKSLLAPGLGAGAVAGGTLAPTEDAEAGALPRFVKGAGRLLVPDEGRISTRFPTAVKATENPLENNLIIDTQTMADSGTLKQNMQAMARHPMFKTQLVNPEKRANVFREQIVDNLLHLHDDFDPELRDQAKLWYDGANRIATEFGERFGIGPDGASAALAALSPQKDWYQNVSLAERTMDIVRNHTGKLDDGVRATAHELFGKAQYSDDLKAMLQKDWPDMTDVQKAMYVRSYDVANNKRGHRIVTPGGEFGDFVTNQDGAERGTGWGSLNEISKAVSVIEDPSVDNISRKMGNAHKVRNFYQNIRDPNDPFGPVTVDTHAVAGGALSPMSSKSLLVGQNFGGAKGSASSSVTGAQGAYGLWADAYRDAAQQVGLQPRQMQSISWEAVRGLFPDNYKTEKNVQAVEQIWDNYRKGNIGLEDAKSQVYQHAGGVDAPSWYKPGTDIRDFKGSARSSFQDNVDGVQLPGGGTRSGAGRGGSRVAGGAGTAAGAGKALAAADDTLDAFTAASFPTSIGSSLLAPGAEQEPYNFSEARPITNPGMTWASQSLRETHRDSPLLSYLLPVEEAAEWSEESSMGRADWLDRLMVGLGLMP